MCQEDKYTHLNGMIEFVASQASYVEKHFAQGVGHSRLGLFQAFDKGHVTATWRSDHRREVAETVFAMTRAKGARNCLIGANEAVYGAAALTPTSCILPSA